MAPITLQATVLSSARLVGAQSLNVRPRAAVRAQRMAVRPAAAAETEAVPEAVAPAAPAAEVIAEAVAPAAEAAAPAAPAADQPPREQRERRQQPRNRMPRAQTIGPARTMNVGEIEAGKEYDGVVVSIRDFGAFVNIGVQTDGLLHISQISTEFVRNVADALTNGQEVRVRVINVDMERGKFAVTMIPEGAAPPPRGGGGGGGGQWDAGDYGDRPQLKQQARAQKARPARSSTPRSAPPVTPGQAIKGKVASVAAFGVFVEIAEGFTGLLHESEMVKVEGASPPSMGDEIDVVVVSVKADKVALSQRSAEELEQEKEMRNGGMRADTNVPAGLGRLAQQLARAGISSEQFESAVGSSE